MAQKAQDPNSPRLDSYGPHAFICQPELLSQFVVDAMKAFKGLRQYVIVSSQKIPPPCPGVKVLVGTKAFLAFQKKMYKRRLDPTVSNKYDTSPLSISLAHTHTHTGDGGHINPRGLIQPQSNPNAFSNYCYIGGGGEGGRGTPSNPRGVIHPQTSPNSSSKLLLTHITPFTTGYKHHRRYDIPAHGQAFYG